MPPRPRGRRHHAEDVVTAVSTEEESPSSTREKSKPEELKPPGRNLRRHAVGEHCPYCDAQVDSFSLLAHVRNEHPGLKTSRVSQVTKPENASPLTPKQRNTSSTRGRGRKSVLAKEEPRIETPSARKKAANQEVKNAKNDIKIAFDIPVQEEPLPKQRISFRTESESLTTSKDQLAVHNNDIIDIGHGAQTSEDVSADIEMHDLIEQDVDEMPSSLAAEEVVINDEAAEYYEEDTYLDDDQQHIGVGQDIYLNTDEFGNEIFGDEVYMEDDIEGSYLQEEVVDDQIDDDGMVQPNQHHYGTTRSQFVRGELRSYNSLADFNGVVDIEEGQDEATKFMQRPRPSRHDPLGDPKGKYPCYIEGCPWRGNFRSVRCTHMRNVHPDWKRPPRFVLDRISKTGQVIPANDALAKYACFIEGCPWRGNYRASRSNHMKTQHKGWIPKRTRAANGGFVANGKYHCHVDECGWRGMSRSTRAVHMRREHPGFVNPIYTPRSITCTDCGSALTSHKLFVDHMVMEHKIGGIVQREFADLRDYEDWFEAVQDSFSIDFVKKMGVKNGPTYQILYLYCARSGGYCPQRGFERKDPAGIYEPRYFKHNCRRDRSGRNCAAFLRVMHWNDGKLSIIGCVEHTGHRLGTALLRLSPIEREAMDEYLYVTVDASPLEAVIDRLLEIEGFSAQGYSPYSHEREFVQKFVLDPSEQISLSKMLQSEDFFPPNCVFGVVLPQPDRFSFSVGWMDEQMAHLWEQYAFKCVCFEDIRVVLAEWELRVMITFVLDGENNPRVAAVYITDQGDRKPLFDRLTNVWVGHVNTFVTDATEAILEFIERYFGRHFLSDPDLQIAEWHLLQEWAGNLDQVIANRVDKFGILCILRRLLRTSDSEVFEQTIHELFDGLREMQLDEVAQYIDNQLEPSHLKRWSPANRNPLTDHKNPTLEFGVKMFRDKFVACEECARIDEYIGFLIQRVREFNNSEMSPVVTSRDLEPPRELPSFFTEAKNEKDPNRAGHDVDDEEGESWATFGQRALTSQQGLRFIQEDHKVSEFSLDAMDTMDVELIEDENELRLVRSLPDGEIIEEVVEEILGDEYDHATSMTGYIEETVQHLDSPNNKEPMHMIEVLQSRVDHVNGDEGLDDNVLSTDMDGDLDSDKL